MKYKKYHPASHKELQNEYNTFEVPAGPSAMDWEDCMQKENPEGDLDEWEEHRRRKGKLKIRYVRLRAGKQKGHLINERQQSLPG